ncbi:hypothetical protein ABTY98_16225 [Streptomyces sp. NPDC096040]|uniref:hypothetical protein n=1 Tax=Streptomyces sp. NPDC096040 TaxID=3155541 RepID=UPI00332369AD
MPGFPAVRVPASAPSIPPHRAPFNRRRGQGVQGGLDSGGHADEAAHARNRAAETATRAGTTTTAYGHR